MRLYMHGGKASGCQPGETSSLKSCLLLYLLGAVSFVVAVPAFGPSASAATINVSGLGDQFGVTSAQVNLGVLGPNGGPTRTHALLPGSIAIDKGKSNGLVTDQRLLKRPCDNPAIANAAGGDGADIGAFEVQGCVPPDGCCCRQVGPRLIGPCCPKPTVPLRL